MDAAGASGWRGAMQGSALALVVALSGMIASPATAQGVYGPDPKNPASRFNGIWNKDGSRLQFDPNPPLRPEARAKMASLRPQDDPSARCVEPGLGRMMIGPSPMQIIAVDNHVLVVAENFHAVRRIWTDTTEHEKNPDPSFYGDTVVRWEGDTMVVDTIGLNGKNYLDTFGTPMSDAMHVVERWRLLNPDKLEIEFSFDDPKNYTQTWKSTFTYSRDQTLRIGEYSCTENNRNDPTDPTLPRGWHSTDQPFGRVLTGQDTLFPNRAPPTAQPPQSKDAPK